MANTVFSTEEITLLDGRQVTLRPVSLKKVRKINKMVRELTRFDAPEGELDEEELADAQEEHFIGTLIEIIDYAMGSEIRNTPEEDLEEILDVETMYKIIEVVAGIKLNDENLIRRAIEMNESGQTSS